MTKKKVRRRVLTTTDEDLKEQRRLALEREEEEKQQLLNDLTRNEALFYASVLLKAEELDENPVRIPHNKIVRTSALKIGALSDSLYEKDAFTKMRGKISEGDWAYYYYLEDHHPTSLEVMDFINGKEDEVENIEHFPALSMTSGAVHGASQTPAPTSISLDDLSETEKKFLAFCQIFGEHNSRLKYTDICFYMDWENSLKLNETRRLANKKKKARNEHLQKWNNEACSKFILTFKSLRNRGYLEGEIENVKASYLKCPSVINIKVLRGFDDPNQVVPSDNVENLPISKVRHLVHLIRMKILMEDAEVDAFGNYLLEEESFENALEEGKKLLSKEFPDLEEDKLKVAQSGQDTIYMKALSDSGFVFQMHPNNTSRKRRSLVMGGCLNDVDLEDILSDLNTALKKGKEFFKDRVPSGAPSEAPKGDVDENEPTISVPPNNTIEEDPDQTEDPPSPPVVTDEPSGYTFPEKEVQDSVVEIFSHLKDAKGDAIIVAKPIIEQIDEMTPWSLTKKEIQNILEERGMIEYGPVTTS